MEKTDAEIEQEQADTSAQEARDKAIARGDFVDDDDVAKGLAENADENGKGKPAAKDGDDAGDDKADGKKAPEGGVPYTRFNEVNAKFTAAQEENLRLEGENRALREMAKGKPAAAAPAAAEPDPDDPAPGVVEPKTLRKMAGDALLEGDSEKYAALQNKADAIIEARATETATARSTESVRAETEAKAATAIEKEIYDAFPFLNHKGAEADKAAIADVIAYRDGLVARGTPFAEALRKAATTIGNQVAEDKGLKPAKAGADLGKERDAKALKKAAETANTQPSIVSGGKGDRGRTQDNDPNDVAKMSDKQFAALPEAEKARLRGDFVVE